MIFSFTFVFDPTILYIGGMKAPRFIIAVSKPSVPVKLKINLETSTYKIAN